MLNFLIKFCIYLRLEDNVIIKGRSKYVERNVICQYVLCYFQYALTQNDPSLAMTYWKRAARELKWAEAAEKLGVVLCVYVDFS